MLQFCATREMKLKVVIYLTMHFFHRKVGRKIHIKTSLPGTCNL